MKRQHALALGDAYAVAAAADLATDREGVTLLVGADDDFDAIEGDNEFEPGIERFRTEAA
ncbi:hypothetical protein [Halonotius sp. GCM10025705]|uniref:hypothetical protein n=1 Tax=Halonotius sp. GCM10025705 TaxID=3252678 RepID=UPI003619474E